MFHMKDMFNICRTLLHLIGSEVGHIKLAMNLLSFKHVTKVLNVLSPKESVLLINNLNFAKLFLELRQRLFMKESNFPIHIMELTNHLGLELFGPMVQLTHGMHFQF